jgi:hypothetical protein
MIFKAVGLDPHGLLARTASRFAWWFIRYRGIRLNFVDKLAIM